MVIIKPKIVFFPSLLGMGHLNISITISKRIIQLYNDQYEIIFLVNKSFAEKIKKICPQIKCEIYYSPFLDKEVNEKEYLKKTFEEFGPQLKIKDRVEFVNTIVDAEYEFYYTNRQIYDEVSEIIRRIKPNFFIYDTIQTSPIGIDQGIPYAMIISCNPCFLGYRKFPAHQSGLPITYTEENQKLWDNFVNKTYMQGKNRELHDLVNNWLKETNSPVNLDDYYLHMSPSPYLNIYNYPNELDFVNDKVKFPTDNWVKLESAILPPLPEPFVLPEKLLKFDNNLKLIYVSLGSYVSSYKELTQRIADIIAQLPYRFIMSGGIFCDELRLGPNTYAEPYINQLAVLQSVDLMISHGGNNSLTEAFYFGCPLIIIPCFADQIENSQNIFEKGLGGKLDPFEFTKEELQNEIEKLTKPEMRKRLKKISERIQNNTGIDKVVESILAFCK